VDVPDLVAVSVTVDVLVAVGVLVDVAVNVSVAALAKSAPRATRAAIRSAGIFMAFLLGREPITSTVI
jgi:hypothetical protein